MNHGFLIPEITQDNWMLRGVGIENKKIINPSRDWRSFLPWGEIQRRNIETSSCTEYGTISAIQTLEKRLFNISPDYSERLVAIGAGNTPQGNNPHDVAEWIRKNGLVKEVVLPFDDTIMSWDDYMQPRPLTDNYLKEAKKWLDKRVFNHEWVFSSNEPLEMKREKLLETLQYSPIGVSVNAWKKKGDLYVKNPDEPDNHWCLLAGANIGKYWIVFDSYMDDDFIKELSWDYNFGYAKSYSLKKNYKKSFWKNYFGCFFE